MVGGCELDEQAAALAAQAHEADIADRIGVAVAAIVVVALFAAAAMVW